MEISETTKIIFYTSRLFGVAPFSIQRNAKGKICDYKKSIFWCIYSAVIFTFIASLSFAFYNLYHIIIKRSIYRMKSPTSKVVTSLDIFVVVLACFCGTMCGLIGLKNTQELNRRLREADEQLAQYTNEVKDRRTGLCMLFTILITLTGILVFDVVCWIRMASKLKNKSAYENVQGYFPFYFLYYVLFVIQTNFAQTSLGLGRRFRRLNIALRNDFLFKDFVIDTRNLMSDYRKFNENKIDDGGKFTKKGTTSETAATTTLKSTKTAMTTKNVNYAVDSLGQKKKNEKFVYATTMVVSSTKSSQLINNLSYTHESLSRAMENVSKAFGPTLLALLASCLLHLVATSYFLLVELLGEKDTVFTYLQLLWLTVHGIRLLLVVEPCHMAYMEARKTTQIVCEIQRTTNDSTIRKCLKTFWQQLLVEQSSFSPCGMCLIDRQILTSYSGALVTYIIILMQFQKTDG